MLSVILTVPAPMHKREVVEAVTVIETVPTMVVGVVGYVETPRGLPTPGTRSKKKGFTRYAKKHAEDGGKSVARELERIRKYCTVIRVLAHTQICKTGLSQKKAYLMQIQVNGGSIPDKVEFAHGLFEKLVEVSSVFEQDECVDIIAVTKGHGFEDVTHRWGTKKRKRLRSLEHSRPMHEYCCHSSALFYPILVPLYYVAMAHAQTLSWIAFLIAAT
ncbi:ribosomal protein L3 [Gymnopus androsaceus JB14]|uniref:Ribosomal protein L3 n=1 Tax=Gymnopus androsaceus JB14 TaxID=1447944 RepID=A0A6A4IFK4_9AGAR|nr:ribosomal protein L3 [Gymnopus androsaceus JB14]